MSRPVAWMLLFAILLLGFFLRCRRLSEHGFWLDESYSAEISAGHGYQHMDLPRNRLIPSPPKLQSMSADAPWWFVFTRQGRDLHPPLYFGVLRAWRAITGSSDGAMRLLSVLFSAAAAALLYATGAALYGRPAGLWCALLMSLASSQLEVARQVRSYAMLSALGCAALLCVALIETRGWNVRRGAALATTALASMATHWLALGFFAGLALYAAAGWRGRNRRCTLVSLAVAAVLALVVIAPLQIIQMRHALHLTWWLVDHQPHHAARILGILRELPIRLFGSPYGPTQLYAGWWVLFALAPVLVWRGRRDLLLPTLALYGTLAFPVVVDLFKGTMAVTQTRYVILVVPPMCLFIVRVLKFNKPRAAVLGHVLPFAVAIFGAMSLFSFYAEPANEDWRALVAPIARDERPGEPIVCVCTRHDDPEALPSTIWLCMSRYVPGGHPLYLADRPLTGEDVRSLGSKSVWVFTAWQMTMPEQLIPQSKTEEFRYYPGLGYLARAQLNARGH